MTRVHEPPGAPGMMNPCLWQSATSKQTNHSRWSARSTSRSWWDAKNSTRPSSLCHSHLGTSRGHTNFWNIIPPRHSGRPVYLTEAGIYPRWNLTSFINLLRLGLNNRWRWLHHRASNLYPKVSRVALLARGQELAGRVSGSKLWWQLEIRKNYWSHLVIKLINTNK